ncbi:hypothetical protein HCU64_07865 [Methylobacterium sp. C25]|uniref:hypothetical protein n=1 Tax=Methylobacterium sp. C25 TaxID=2721622 RepID=UPI001F1CE419|nr:hypothetical protein [Methylobacterium sp. C25]MCE4223662.1 hypothetical protein [Methylobacterium sp. C25]
MRSILAGLALVLLPSLASAECQCVCIRGKAIPVCQPQAMVEPICQQVCTDKIEQSLGATGIGGAGGSSGGMAGQGAGAGGLDPSTLKAIMGR